MGTHPIFESDFDCLTEIKMNNNEEIPVFKENSESELDETDDPEVLRIENRKLKEMFF